MLDTCQEYLNSLIDQIPHRSVGSQGNRQATEFFRDTVQGLGWQVEETEFEALDWHENGAHLEVGGKSFEVLPSPYSKGCQITSELVAAGSLNELQGIQAAGKILLLHSDLTREQLMPKNFVFYNPDEHQQLISLLEELQPAAILAATSRNAALAGGIYPFPLIEDGDFEIPSLYLTAEEGLNLLENTGWQANLISRATRNPSPASTLVARKGQDASRRYAISAHIDAKIGTPGAIDNGTGVVVLLLLAELLADYQGSPILELLPFNGEDYYAASGQMIYIQQNQGKFDQIQLNINIDGAGYYQGPSAFSPFNLPPSVESSLSEVLDSSESLILGEPWVQGDHSIFLQQGVPAIAVTSKWFLDHIDSQEITHTSRDNLGIVDCQPVVEIADAVHKLILALTSQL